MSSAALRLLDDRLHRNLRTELRRDIADFLRLMPDDRQYLRGLKRLARAHDLLKERASTGAVKYFRQCRTHARPFPRGQNYERCVGGSHKFDNCPLPETLSQPKQRIR